jgi:hypothetical protein
VGRAGYDRNMVTLLRSAPVAALLLMTSVTPQNGAELREFGKVRLMRVPEGGIQPQVAVDGRGEIHMIYFKGDPGHGDVYYVRAKNDAAFSKPMKVNTQPGSAVAAGNIRGAHIAAGKNGRVHVAWNGAHAAGGQGKEPMLYTRLNDAGTAFEPERNVIQFAHGLDGGGAVAADAGGNVYVVWHAPEPGTEGEGHRRVWIARSTDEGKTFERERAAFDKPTGACGCCGLNAFADRSGALYVVYRSATELVNRDMYLLVSRDKGQTFQGQNISKWNVGHCVMSSESFAENGKTVMTGWETEKQVYFGRIDSASGKLAQAIGAPGATDNRKHPALAVNAAGETLLAWTEGMAWKKGGTLGWQIHDSLGKPLGEKGTAAGVPVWSLLAAFARPDGGFTIVY